MLAERSLGGVVYRETPDGPQLLLIRDAYGRWSLPKGHPEPGESDEAAALREIAEETGVDGEVVGTLGETRYTFRDARGPVKKTVRYFLVRAVGGEVRPQAGEIADCRWFPAEEAVAQSSYANNRPVLEAACRRLGVRVDTSSTAR